MFVMLGSQLKYVSGRQKLAKLRINFDKIKTNVNLGFSAAQIDVIS